jgi:hypothetical protein
VFGGRNPVQRCHHHKIENVMGYLPEVERASESSHDVLFRAILAGIRDFNSVFAQDYRAATKVELRAKEGEAFLDRWMIGYLQCT